MNILAAIKREEARFVGCWESGDGKGGEEEMGQA